SNDPALPPELFNLPGTELTATGAAKIAGLTALMTAFGVDLNAPNPSGVRGFNAGNILLGGLGSDLIEGKGGDDLIDGDAWLNVQLEATYAGPDGVVGTADDVKKLVNSPRELVDDVFSDPQKLNPGNIRIVRSIVSPPTPLQSDCP